jgi:hypothetical protein
VKYFYSFLGLLVIAFASSAQETVSQDSGGKPIVDRNSQPVASPNRTSSREWARAHLSHKTIKGNDNKGLLKTGAPVWVDSKGEIVGRVLPEGGGMLVPFENKFAEILGLSDRDCDINGDCTLTGGITWSKSFSLAYNTTDCTGTPYILNASPRTRYFGIPIFEKGETFIYISDTTQTTAQGRGSVFDGKDCFRVSRFNPTGAPAIAVLPASTFGTQPYSIK